MREIKFRAWNGHKMLYMGKGGFCDFELAGGDVFVCGDGAYDFVKQDFPLMQYTGLKDANGVEIYEGDVVRCSNEYRTVKMWMGNACLCVSWASTGFPIYPYNVNNHVEVIGNIYENPELIKGDTK